MTLILVNNGNEGAKLSQAEIDSNAALMLTAGSETTATLLSGATWLLLKNSDVMQKLRDEIRGKFKTYDDIMLDAVNKTPYLIAVLSEALKRLPSCPGRIPTESSQRWRVRQWLLFTGGDRVLCQSLCRVPFQAKFQEPRSFRA